LVLFVCFGKGESSKSRQRGKEYSDMFHKVNRL
jgi:hypothetical protein